MGRQLLLAAVIVSVAVHVVSAAPPGAVLARPDFRQIIQAAKAKVFPAVVYIRVVRENTEEGRQGLEQVSGSGVLISPAGEVLTNWHVVDKARSVRCLLFDGRPLDAEVLGVDQDTDLALLQLEVPEDSSPFPFAEIGRSASLNEGDFVMAMGAPFGLNRSVSIGIISCTRRYLTEVSEYSLWLQTDAAINPGNSGGPLVDTEGRVVGLNARGIGWAEGMGFAIPEETISILVPQLREHGKVNWSWTGLQLQVLRDFNRDIYFDETEGVIVAGTDPGSPARRAGIAPRDRIVSVNGRPLTALTEENLPAVRRTLGLLPMGEPASFEVVRRGELIAVEVTPRAKGQVEGDDLVCERWNLTLKTINQFDNPDLYFHRKSGVFVYGVKYPGNAAAAGLWPNDIVLTIGGRPVETLDDVRAVYDALMANIDSSHRAVFAILRNGLMRQIVLDFLRDYSRE